MPKRQTVPGAAVGFDNMNQVQQFNRGAMRRKGFLLRGAQGNNVLKIELPGTAKFLLGLLIYDDSGQPLNTVNLMINNDVVIEQVSTSSLCRLYPNVADPTAALAHAFDDEFFPVYAPLSGNDSITLEMNLLVGSTNQITFYYI